MTIVTATVTEAARMQADEGYNEWLDKVAQKFHERYVMPAMLTPLFKVELSYVDSLYDDVFLPALPQEVRQYLNCSACREFMNKYGSLVEVDSSTGVLRSAIWRMEGVPTLYQNAVLNVITALAHRGTRIKGIFHSKDRVWGKPQTGEWTHFSVTPGRRQWTNRIRSAHSAMTTISEDHKTLLRYIAETNTHDLQEAVRVLESDQVFRSEKALGAAQWLVKMKALLERSQHDKNAKNLIWYEVATAPAGFCHPASTMIGTLVSDIVSGQYTFHDIRKRFAEKMNPLIYQRPQTDPSEGNLTQAEDIVAKLGVADSLRRRFATISDIQDTIIWSTHPTHQYSDEVKPGVFGHLRPRKQQEREVLTIPPTVMTWAKFMTMVLPEANEIEYWTVNEPKPIAQLCTAAVADSPPILQWDDVNDRNQVSLYMHTGGSLPHFFSLVANRWVNVLCVTELPWQRKSKPLKNRPAGVVFCLEDCVDVSGPIGIALFPEILINELHSVRRSIEAYSKSKTFEPLEDGHPDTAAGPSIMKGGTPNYKFRVTSEKGIREYIIDRWD